SLITVQNLTLSVNTITQPILVQDLTIFINTITQPIFLNSITQIQTPIVPTKTITSFQTCLEE
ncbi:26387_t:CDS:2, partial [Racocetra persica]